MAVAQISFASWVRRGLASAVARTDQTPAGAIDTKVTLELRFNDSNAFVASPSLTLVGPGDIIGFDARAIVRTFPRPDDNDAEAGYFASIEFDQADLPWRYTPASARGDTAAKTDTLRPWFNLIVLVEGDEVNLENDLSPASAGQKLPHLTTKLKYLPNLDESWAWAHVQVSAPEANVAALAGAGTVARLLSPRRLEQSKAYSAFLVPTFKRGLLVGTARTPAEWATDRATVDALEPAWAFDAAGEGPITLPVYHHWRFQTGALGSFEELAMALTPEANLPDTVGTRQLDIAEPGLELPPPLAIPTGQDLPEHMLLGGALQSLAAAAKTDPTLTPEWRGELAAFLDTPIPDGGTSRVVAPPLYGRWHAEQRRLDSPEPPPPLANQPWFYQLNSDPRHRVGSALGTEVVQRDQQALMASAWAQVEGIEAINRERAVMQVAVQTLRSLLGRSITVGSIESLLTLTSPLHGRIRVGATGTAFASIAASPLGIGFFEPAWRRLASPVGAIGLRLGLHLLADGQATNLFDRINTGQFVPAPRPGTPVDTNTPQSSCPNISPGGLPGAIVDGLVQKLGRDQLNFWGQVIFWVARHLLIAEGGRFWWLLHRLMRLGLALVRLAADPQQQGQRLREKVCEDTLDADDVEAAPQAPSFRTIETIPPLDDPSDLPQPPVPPQAGQRDNDDADRVRTALGDLRGYLRRDIPDGVAPVPLNFATFRPNLTAALEPLDNISAIARARHNLGDFIWTPKDPLEPIQAAPTFPQPMYLPLRELSPEWILPNGAGIPRNTVSVLVPNPRFIEAYMVGLSHEMARELLWNHYPTDQRGTYFRQFWDSRGWVDGGQGGTGPRALEDIKEIHTWDAGASLGQNGARQPPGTPAVVLIRGDLIKRYPNVVVYAAAARPPGEQRLPNDTIQSYPIFQGRLSADTAFYGFELSPAEFRGSLEPPAPEHGWYLVVQEQPTEPRFDIPAAPDPPPPTGVRNVAVSEIPGATTAAKVAFEQYATPKRVAIHGGELVPAT